MLFLYAVLDEEIFIEQQEGTCEPGNKELVWLLLRCLHGLKQSPRLWNEHIDEVLKDIGF